MCFLRSVLFLIFFSQQAEAFSCRIALLRVRSFFNSKESLISESEIRNRDDGSVVTPWYYRGRLAAIMVKSADGAVVTYERTNRPIVEYSIPIRIQRQLTNGDMRGKRVLDVGMGGGKAVEQMRKAGVEAEGVDLFLDESQIGKNFFHEADMEHMPMFEDGTFDLLIHNQSLFNYTLTRANEPQYEKGLNVLREFTRLIKTGGQVILGDVPNVNLEDILKKIPNLRVVDVKTGAPKWIVLEKVSN